MFACGLLRRRRAARAPGSPGGSPFTATAGSVVGPCSSPPPSTTSIATPTSRPPPVGRRASPSIAWSASSTCWATRRRRTRSSTSPAPTARARWPGWSPGCSRPRACRSAPTPAPTWSGSTSGCRGTVSPSTTRRWARPSARSRRWRSSPGVVPSYFEILTAAAFGWFADVAVDAAVVEVGMLGRWDATNVVDAAVAVCTNVGRDHTDGPRGGARPSPRRRPAS